jgi:carbonic anhydrase
MNNIKKFTKIRINFIFILCISLFLVSFEGLEMNNSKKMVEFVTELLDTQINNEVITLKNEFMNGVEHSNKKEENENLFINAYSSDNNNNNIYENKKNTEIQNSNSYNFKENLGVNIINDNNNTFKEEKKYEISENHVRKPFSSKIDNNIIEDWLKITSPEFFKVFNIPNISSKDKNLRVKLNSEEFRINESYEKNKINDDNFPKCEEYFWFRLVDKEFFYAKTKTDLNVIGSLEYRKVSKYNSLCMCVKDNCNIQWSVCANSREIINKFYCKIKKNLNEENLFECPVKKEDNINNKIPSVPKKKLLQPIILLPMAARNCNEKWNYSKNGKDWECICSMGKFQSPIDLPSKSAALDSSVRPAFNYYRIDHDMKCNKTILDNSQGEGENIKIRYFNNAIRILHHDLGKITTIDGAVYVAEEILFHVPSEHTIEGKRYDMEMQVLHYGRSKGDIAKQVVLSFLFEKSPGVYNKLLDDFDFYSLPNNLNREIRLVNDIFIPKVQYRSDDPSYAPVMKPFSFYTYQGSLTFPPCTERTIHYVAADPIPIGVIFIQMMKEALHEKPQSRKNILGESLIISEGIFFNNRETQPLNGRSVFYFDHTKYCWPYKREPCVPKSINTLYQENHEIIKISHSNFLSDLPNSIDFVKDK